MQPDEIRSQLDLIVKQLSAAREVLSTIYPYLLRNDDRAAARSTGTDLLWACENLTVIGRHQVGEALDDHMGTGLDGQYDVK